MEVLFKPFIPELPELEKILHSGMIAYGKNSKEFEDKLRRFFGTPYLLVTNSFETAISVALTTLDISHGDDVIVSPMACLASTQPYINCGATVKWCDIDPHTGTLDPNALECAITKDTKAIIHNHFCGYPGYIDEINSIAEKYGIKVIDDGIECFGTEYKGKKIGFCGTDVTVFSLNAVRFSTTIDGGIIIFKDKEHYEKAMLVRDCGIDRTRFRDEFGEISRDCDITLRGFSATMSDVNGYIGSRQMDDIEERISKHRENAHAWDRLLNDRTDIALIKCNHGLPNYWVYGILVKEKSAMIKHFREKGFYASGVHINNNIYSVFADKTELKGVNEFSSRFLALPCGWWINKERILEYCK